MTQGFAVEALVQAAAALQRQSSSGSTNSNAEQKISWKDVNLSFSIFAL